MNNPEIKTEWTKVPSNARLTFVGRDVVCVGAGCNLVFLSLSTGEQRVYAASGPASGDGVHCYAGHRHLPYFAFAEKCIDPRIIIVTYPDFQILRTIEEGAPEGYLTLCFSDHEYLISLSNLPQFEITIWNWRTKDRLCSKRTKVHNPNQILSPSFHLPLSVVQYYEKTSKLLMWEIHNCYKRCVMIRYEIEMPNNDLAVDVAWNTEGALFVMNVPGDIYMLNTEIKLELIIYGLGIGHDIPTFDWFKGGLIVVEPNMDIKHFRRSGTWVEDWNVCPASISQLKASSGHEHLVGWSNRGEILELDLSKYIFAIRKHYGSIVDDMYLINPICDYFVTLTKPDELRIWECLTGTEVGNIKATESVLSIASNPVYPYVATGLATGVLELISVYDINNISILTTFNLFKEEITKIIFTEEGDVIAAANLKFGLFFIIDGVPGMQMKIKAYVDYRRQTVDICISSDENNYKLYILVKDEVKCCNVGQRIVVKTISKTSDKIKKKKYIFQDKKYSKLTLINGVFHARHQNSKNITTIQFTRKFIKVVNKTACGHLLRSVCLQNNSYYVYTFGYDGLVIVRSKDLSEINVVLMPHHRSDKGVHKVLVDPLLRFVISLGNDSTLVCTKLITKINMAVRKEQENKLIIFDFMFKQKTGGFPFADEDADKTYLEIETERKLAREIEQYQKERMSIMEEFQILQNEVVSLLEANLNGPELEKIDIQEFYLHSRLKEYKEKMTEKECEWTVKYYKEVIRVQDNMWVWMKGKYWDSMDVQRSFIHGILSNFTVENYTLLLTDKAATAFDFYFVIMLREFEEMMRLGDELKPWLPMSESAIQVRISHPPCLAVVDESVRILEVLENEEDVEEQTDITEARNYPSSSASEFIETCKYLYEQEEIQAFAQVNFQRLMHREDNVKLRKLFNERFEDMMQQKIRDMNAIVEKNKRLRYILSELKNYDIIIEDPEWLQSEFPENLIKVLPNEIGITPYISPSEQALLDWKAAEEERIRLLLLADDFREKALIKMMDGVLEVRWEDTLKRDIPKPKCMLEKEPENFNEEDLRAIRDYEEKVNFLNSERQRYRNMLEQEYGKVSESVREGVKKFNQRLRELLLFKIKIESARSQNVLSVQRYQIHCNKRIYFAVQEELMKKKIKENNRKISWTQKKLSELFIAAHECRIANDSLVAKEKVLDKNFKKDFQDYSALIQEQAGKLYKKHPKMQVRGVNIVSVLIELGSCCVSQEKTPILTQECLEYLRSVDALDQYIGVPNTIDENLYKTICKHRRLRLENEIKIKANGTEQSEIDLGTQTFQKLLVNDKEMDLKLHNELAQLRRDKLHFVHNKELQIVLKQGLIEVKTTGRFFDFDDAIMINRNDVDNINAIILKAGQLKLKVMQDKMIHRRSILMKEWDHKKMKMQIEDLKEFLYMIERVKLTKEIQLYLRQRAKGESIEKGMLTLDQEVEITKNTYEKIIIERQNAVKELDNQIKDFQKKNKILDIKIAEINVDVCEQHVNRDLEFEKKEKESLKKRMTAIVKRSKLIKQIQDQHNEILVLQTELELLRLKTYPTLKFKTLY